MSATAHEFEYVRIQTYVLKVQIHCHGCMRKVKKLLKRIEGVYQVKMDAEEQVVIVYGNVDAATLIKKLNKSGKHAKLLSENPLENHETQLLYNWFNDNNNHQNQGALNWCDYEKTHNPELLNWLNNIKHQNQMHSSYNNSLGISKMKPMFDHWGNNEFLDRSIGIGSLTGETNQNFYALGNMDYPYSSQEENITNNADFGITSPFENLQSIQAGRRNSMVDFQGLRSTNPSFAPNQSLKDINSRFADLGSKELGLRNLHTARGVYGYQPRPFSEMNDMQACRYSYPASTLMNSHKQNMHGNGIDNFNSDIYAYQPGSILNQRYGVFPPNISHPWNVNVYNT